MQKMKNLNILLLYQHGIVLSLRLGLTSLLLTGVLSCTNLGRYGWNTIGANITPIQEIKPQKEDDATVYIQGHVEKRVPLLKRLAYQIDDSTGKVWVLTNQTGIKEGDKVVFKGKIRYQSIPIAGKEYGEVYLEE
ncbi:hypothetical protein WA1_08890 [Scytonema hofmannii PCC 7110]|uniref:Uncharacterized protein n=1 Tax=Scytonema hofmannii PCC 7110 TaxID=128403 RepID=A0A139WS53_9CYAN|nr:hypothetical protein [Scytonema hofmannii]KYC35260.1 hypothetical protein WA1_08890 [Scytonema hofmannii PCC 7110]